ncbi:hypothetical protein B0H13DRAFT_2290198 [Mycena leptocephala]|nr:hypothetical protein B0H13DRAFT_2290198 [Mycena leptocephala]
MPYIPMHSLLAFVVTRGLHTLSIAAHPLPSLALMSSAALPSSLHFLKRGRSARWELGPGTACIPSHGAVVERHPGPPAATVYALLVLPLPLLVATAQLIQMQQRRGTRANTLVPSIRHTRSSPTSLAIFRSFFPFPALVLCYDRCSPCWRIYCAEDTRQERGVFPVSPRIAAPHRVVHTTSGGERAPRAPPRLSRPLRLRRAGARARIPGPLASVRRTTAIAILIPTMSARKKAVTKVEDGVRRSRSGGKGKRAIVGVVKKEDRPGRRMKGVLRYFSVSFVDAAGRGVVCGTCGAVVEARRWREEDTARARHMSLLCAVLVVSYSSRRWGYFDVVAGRAVSSLHISETDAFLFARLHHAAQWHIRATQGAHASLTPVLSLERAAGAGAGAAAGMQWCGCTTYGFRNPSCARLRVWPGHAGECASRFFLDLTLRRLPPLPLGQIPLLAVTR